MPGNPHCPVLAGVTTVIEYSVKCHDCGWSGETAEYIEYPEGSGIPWIFCPECGAPEGSLDIQPCHNRAKETDMDDWQPPADVKAWIVCAACRTDDFMLTGPRHFDEIMRNQIRAMGIGLADWEQGFVDQWGRFYNRTEAMNIVMESGQPIDLERNGPDPTRLYSEGLY